MSLSRIYQGRVSGLKLLEPKTFDGEPVSEAQRDQILMRHHAEFQKAVNYHQFQLLRLSTDEESPLGRIRKRMLEADVAARRLRAQDWKDEKEKRGLQDLAAHDVWNGFRRDGRRRPGMCGSVAEALGISPDTPLAEAFEVVGERCDDPGVSAELYDLAVRALVTDLGGDGAIQKKGREYLPRFCDPGFSGAFPRSDTARMKKQMQEALPAKLHAPDTAGKLEELKAELEFGHFANVNEKSAILDRERCRDLFKEGIGLLVLESGLTDADASRLARLCDALPEDFALPSYRGASVKGILRNRFFAFLVFKYLEASPATFRVLRDTYPEPKTVTVAKKVIAKPRNGDGTDFLRFGDDPLKLARGGRGMVYPGYTSLAHWVTPEPGEMGWKEFDIAAFKEALKAFNQVKGRTEERETKRDRVLDLLRYMEQGGKPPKSKTGEEEDDADGITFAGDDRFPKFQALLAELKTQDGDGVEEYAAGQPHDLRFRAIRGRKDLFAAWNRHLRKAGEPAFDKKGHETTLLEILNKHQAEHRDDMGWARLFRALCKREHFDIWREPSAEEAAARRTKRHSNDFPGDYVKWAALVIDAGRLKEPIRFSPADDEDSRRLFMFSDACAFKPRGAYRHLPDAPAVIVPVAFAQGGLLTKRRVRLDYSAPRLLRDGLRGCDGGLAGSAWNQPMMEALGMEGSEAKQDISGAAVALMPDRDRKGDLRFLLNFPLSLEQDKVAAKVGELRGQSIDWGRQMVSYGKGGDVQHFYLRWPGFDKEDAKTKPWFGQTKAFQVLSVDLGVRFAGACARVKAYAGADKKEERDREIGTAGGSVWHAQVERLIALRLPGEGRKVPAGDDHADGRWAGDEEIAMARGIIFDLDQHPGHLGFDEGRYRVGEVAAKLLVALRRGMTHLRTLQRWGRMKGKWEDAKKEIGDSHQREFKLREEAAARGEQPVIAAWSGILDALSSAEDCRIKADELKEKLRLAVERVADFLVPLRHGNWQWHRTAEAVDGRTPCHVLRQVEKAGGTPANRNRDQGGLSVARISRITDFRKILQSFNRLYGLEGDQVPPSGREMRSHPLPDPCRELSAKLEAMKEQRVNQTAHWILAEAIGLELRESTRPKEEKRKLDLHGEYVRKRPPVDFIVVEDLIRYRTTQGRTRQENSRLMQWCHRQVTAKLKMLCEAYGLVVVETPAAYSSRFCSRTGQPGFRAEHVTKRAFEKVFHWRQAVQRAEKDPDAAASKVVLAARDTFSKLPGKSKKSLLLPRPGGGVFVPSGEGSVQNADLNAAVNLALRAIASPDRFDIHTRIRSEWVKDAYQTRETRNRFGPKPVGITVTRLQPKADGSAPEALEARPNFFFIIGGLKPGFDQAALDSGAAKNLCVHSGRSLWKAVNDGCWSRAWQGRSRGC